MPRYVFVTYAHDSLAHERRVLELANELRTGGIDAQIDQYEPHPSEGWPKWMERQFIKAEFILVVPSKKYLARYAQDAGIGSGARFEAAILTSILSKNGVSFEKIGVILFDEEDQKFIPDLLHGCTRYNVSNKRDGELLYRWLTNQPNVLRPNLGSIKKLSPLNLSSAQQFSLLCTELKPILEDNYRIFRDFGPNSESGSLSPVRHNLGTWYALRLSKIVPNNASIRNLITSNRDVIPPEHKKIFAALISHIDAFEVHVADERVDYADHQFPADVVNVIEQNAL